MEQYNEYDDDTGDYMEENQYYEQDLGLSAYDSQQQEDIETFSSPPVYGGHEYPYQSQTYHPSCDMHTNEDLMEDYIDFYDDGETALNNQLRTPEPGHYPTIGQAWQSRASSSGNRQTNNYHPISSFMPPNATNQRNISIPTSAKTTAERTLRPVSSLPDVYRGIFNFGVFNAMQSNCFDHIFHSEENMVISAPTGSGKTVLFELAMIQMFQNPQNSGRVWKSVYIAPTKALCAEKHRDWSKKFEPLGIKCCELTGDTVLFGKGAWGDAKSSSIIVTTGEKWDSLTRNWGDHAQILSSVHLLLVDEVHILKESRGSTLEAVISRMKSRGSSVRFVLVSATVPNIVDVASWIGSSQLPGSPAQVCEFGEEFRPCKLKRIVIGVYRSKNQNDFVFNRTLDYKLFGALQQHSVGKPILVFCSTRKGVSSTAEQLTKEFSEAEKQRQKLPWSRPTRAEITGFEDKRVAEFAMCGIGIHHAGLSLNDRRLVEDLYLKKVLRIVVATSTLAVGVNLPAHLVVIKGVQTFQNNASVEYSDLDIMQMLGRAGRPQFDKDGIAIILCEEELENKYRALVQGCTILESSLHINLSEHLNSEVGLGTITSVSSAKSWLRGSFLFQRIQKNPGHYCIKKDDAQTWEERVDELVIENLKQLRMNSLIEGAGENLQSTEYGDIMSKFYIRQTTMASILALPENPTLRELLDMLSIAEEFNDIKLRSSEKTIRNGKVLNKLRKNIDIRFEMLKLDKPADKVLLLTQAVLGGIPLNTVEYRSGDSQLYLEALGIFRHSARIARALVEVGIVKSSATLIKNGLELVRCLTAKAWEDRPVVLRQIHGIGEKSLMVLAEQGITSIEKLRSQNPQRIEVLLNRNPPFGLEVIAAVKELPHYYLSITQRGVHSNGGDGPVEVKIAIECGLTEPDNANKPKKQKLPRFNMTAVLTTTSDMKLLDFRRIPTKALRESKTFDISAQLTKPSQCIIVTICAETIAGVTHVKSFRPNVDPGEYPTMNTRPPTSTEFDMVGLEEDPDFWNMELEPSEENVQIRDLTTNRAKGKSVPSDREAIAKINAAQEQRPRNQSSSRRLPNGRFACNHSCRDKTNCRHMCCRDGLPSPPVPSKKKMAADHAGSRDRAEDKAPSDGAVKRKSENDNRIKDLDKLHEKTNVRGNIHLSPSHRLKIDSRAQQKKKNPVPDFEFSNLGETRSQANLWSIEDTIVATLDDEDDLPEAHNLINARPQPSGSEPSWDSDDAWNVTVIEPEHEQATLWTPEDAGSSSEIIFSSKSSPIERTKRRRSPTPDPSPRKRGRKFQTDVTLNKAERDSAALVPLFMPASSDGEDGDRAQEPGALPLGWTHLTTKNRTEDVTDEPTCVGDEQVFPVEAHRDEELDELDAFLNSNAVEIV